MVCTFDIVLFIKLLSFCLFIIIIFVCLFYQVREEVIDVGLYVTKDKLYRYLYEDHECVPAEDVVLCARAHRERSKFNVQYNNCEDFAVRCKTIAAGAAAAAATPGSSSSYAVSSGVAAAGVAAAAAPISGGCYAAVSSAKAAVAAAAGADGRDEKTTFGLENSSNSGQ